MYECVGTVIPVLPCVACGTEGGLARAGRPYRYNGERIGHVGKVCFACYQKCRRSKAGREHAAKRVIPPVVPCAKCGTLEGRSHKNCKTGRPGRRRASVDGVVVWMCYPCFNRMGTERGEDQEYGWVPTVEEIRREAAKIQTETMPAVKLVKLDKALARQRANAERARVARLEWRAEVKGMGGPRL